MGSGVSTLPKSFDTSDPERGMVESASSGTETVFALL